MGSGALRFGSAPVTFGVDEVQADGWRPSPESIVDAIASLGLEGSELGPPGFLGDPRACRELLTRAGLQLIAGYLPLRLSRAEHIEADLASLRIALEDLRQRTPDGSTPKAILADLFCEPDRLAWAGAIERHPEASLPVERQELLVASLHRAAELCQQMGFDAVVHPHAGTYIETEAEVRFVAERLDPAIVGLCLDTGHIRFGGADPATIARDYRHVVRHVHVKDCDAGVLRGVVVDEPGLKVALQRGVFCELGTGDAGIAEVIHVLDEIGYDGWVVIEQDRQVAPGTQMSDLIASLHRSLEFIEAAAARPPMRRGASFADASDRPD